MLSDCLCSKHDDQLLKEDAGKAFYFPNSVDRLCRKVEQYNKARCSAPACLCSLRGCGVAAC